MIRYHSILIGIVRNNRRFSLTFLSRNCRMLKYMALGSVRGQAKEEVAVVVIFVMLVSG